MPWAVAAAAVGAAGTIYAGSQAASAQESKQQQAIDEQNKVYSENQTNEQPYMNAGTDAVARQQAYLNGDTSGFMNSPDYKFAVQQGTAQLDAGAAAGGNLWGGGADADRISLGQGLATQYANNYWNKITGVAGQGLSATNALAGVGTNTANQISGQLDAQGQASASSYANTANSVSNLANQGANIYGQYQQNQSSYQPNGSSTTAANGSNVTYSNTDPGAIDY